MSKPVVSVVIPCFNVAETVSETIASVTAQTTRDFEIIAVDNNCTDNTIEVLTALSTTEPRLRIIKEAVQGISAARNGGIRAARGEFLALLDSDDLWDPEFLDSHVTNLVDGRADVSYSRVRMIDMAGRPTGEVTRPQLNGLTPTDLLLSNPCTSLIVVRAQVFRDVGLYDEELRSLEDLEWPFRAAYGGAKFRGIDRILASYRTTPDGLSADLDTMLQSHEQLLQAAARIAPDLVAQHGRRARATMLRYCARRAMQHNKGQRVAWGYLVQMMRAGPELFLHEPLATTTAMARVLLSGLGSPPRHSPALQAKEI